MGAGKTTIGRFLANSLDLEFVDLDTEIEQRCGANIPWIFDVEGEEGFRKREAQLLEEITEKKGFFLRRVVAWFSLNIIVSYSRQEGLWCI